MFKNIKKLSLILICLIISSVLCACGRDKVETTEMEENTVDSSNENIVEQTDWVANLKIAEETNQILAVVAKDNFAMVSFHEKDADGIWTEILLTQASIGRNGIGKTQEGDGKTPTGVYHFTFAFGIKENPGTNFEYVQVDESHYWVDDSNSKYYNQFVSTMDVEKDWDSAEHILSEEGSYNYVLATDYNAECKPGAGSAIFMHCTPTGGAGCIAVSEESMIAILQRINPDCVLIIDNETDIYSY